MRFLYPLGVLVLAVTVAGCGEPLIGDRTVARWAVEQRVGDAFGEQTGRAPDEVRCQGNLVLEVGATQECAIRTADRWVAATATYHPADEKGNLTAKIGSHPIPEPSWGKPPRSRR